MRLVQIAVPTGKLDAVRRALDEEDVEYVLTEETGGREFAAVASVPLPTNAVEPVLDRLREAGVDESAITVVLNAETVVSREFEQLQNRYDEEKSEDRIAREELVASANDLLPSMKTYLVMTVVSAVIAAAGLLLNSVAVIVGSMVIAPLIGPAMAASVGTVVDNDDLFVRGVKFQAIGVVTSIASAAALGWLVQALNLVPPIADVTVIPEVERRLYPDFLSLVVALGAGIAGALSLTAGVPSAIVGVMIAVALIPPAATVGLGIAWGQPVVSIGSGVLVLVNLLSINFAALLVLWYTGYRPSRWFEVERARGETVRRIAVLAVAILALSVFLGGVTYDTYQEATTEEDIRAAVEGALADESGVELLELRVEHSRQGTLLLRRPDTVVATVGIDSRDRPGVAAELDAEIEAVVGSDIRTEVRYVVVESA